MFSWVSYSFAAKYNNHRKLMVFINSYFIYGYKIVCKKIFKNLKTHWFLIIVLFAGCSSDDSANVIPLPKPTVQFPESSLWGPKVDYLTLEIADRTEATSITKNQFGDVCFIVRDATTDTMSIDPANWNSHLRCLDKEGEQKLQLSHSGTGLFKHALHKADGTLLVAELIDFDPDKNNGFYLQLSHYDIDGSLLSQRLLEDSPTDDELYLYDFRGEEVTRDLHPDFTREGKPVVFAGAKVEFVLNGDQVFLLAYTYGIKFYALSQALTVDWSEQVMPAHLYLWWDYAPTQSSVAFGEDKSIYIAFDGFSDEAEAYRWHFNRTLEVDNELSNIFVAVYDSNGNFEQIVNPGNTAYGEQLNGITYRDKKLWIAANLRHNKLDPSSATDTEWDSVLMQLNTNTADLEQVNYHIIDFDEEDFMSGFSPLPNGNFLLSGKTGFVQADTNSQVSYGDGLFVEVNPQGEVQRSVTLQQPRDVFVRAAQVLSNHQILFAATFDGPITHTCEQDTSLCYIKSAVGLVEF